MTLTSYSNGYGLRESPPHCQERPSRVDCPCCGGSGEHTFGAGMDADGVTCSVCKGAGELALSVLKD